MKPAIWDGSFLNANAGNAFNIMRFVHAPLIKSGVKGDGSNYAADYYIRMPPSRDFGDDVAKYDDYASKNKDELDMATGIISGGINTMNWRFGSGHTNVINFAIGDGSVRSVPWSADTFILTSLSDVDDGVSEGIP